MWCLARMLPLLIGDLTTEGYSHWKNFLLLLQIQEILFAPATSPELAAYLAALISNTLRPSAHCTQDQLSQSNITWFTTPDKL